MSTIKQELAANIVFEHDYTKGTIADQSENSNNGVFNSSPYWVNARKGKALAFNGTSDFISVADTGTVDMTNNFTISVLVDGDGENTTFQINKKTTSNSQASGWQFYHNAPNFFDFVGVGTGFQRTSTNVLCGTHTYTMVMKSDNTVSLYIDGLKLTATNSYSGGELTANNDDIRVQHRDDAQNTFSAGSMHKVLILNTALTDQQVSELHNEVLKEAYVHAFPKRILLPEQTEDIAPANLQLKLSMGSFDGLTISDISGNGNDGTLAGTPDISSEEGLFGNGLRLIGATGGGHFTCGDINALDGVSAITYAVWIKPGAGFSEYDGFICKGTSIAARHNLQAGGGVTGTTQDLLCIVANGASAYGYTTSAPLQSDAWIHLVMVFDGSLTGNANRLKLYVNGSQESLSYDATTIPATTAANTKEVFIGRDEAGNDRTLIGLLDQAEAWDTALTSVQVTQLYKQGHGKIDLLAAQEDMEVTVSNES